jgi:hypothetical protein
MNVQTAWKKEPSVRWLRVRIENSNNISLKKSTLDTLLLRTYKQTELLCTHINNRNSMLLAFTFQSRGFMYAFAQSSEGSGTERGFLS